MRVCKTLMPDKHKPSICHSNTKLKHARVKPKRVAVTKLSLVSAERQQIVFYNLTLY